VRRLHNWPLAAARRWIPLALTLGTLALLPGCGGGNDAVDPLLGDVAKARDAKALTSLQQALTAAALVRAESGGYGSGGDLVQKLQAKDPSKRFTSAPSTGPDDIQVLSGGSAAMMLVARSPSGAYLAVWDNAAGTTLYYRGDQPPQFARERPAGPDWTPTPPQ
jgi:hypothetical protein